MKLNHWPVGLTAAGTLSAAAAQSPTVPHLFVPAGVFYQDGAFLRITPYADRAKNSMEECMDLIRVAVGKVLQQGTGDGSTLIGMCVPVPAHMAASKN